MDRSSPLIRLEIRVISGCDVPGGELKWITRFRSLNEGSKERLRDRTVRKPTAVRTATAATAMRPRGTIRASMRSYTRCSHPTNGDARCLTGAFARNVTDSAGVTVHATSIDASTANP